jgi:hypothetical protein
MYPLDTIKNINAKKTKCAIFVDGRTAWDTMHRCKLPATYRRVDNGDANLCHVHVKDISVADRHLFVPIAK